MLCFFLKEVNTFIDQRWLELIKSAVNIFTLLQMKFQINAVPFQSVTTSHVGDRRIGISPERPIHFECN